MGKMVFEKPLKKARNPISIIPYVSSVAFKDFENIVPDFFPTRRLVLFELALLVALRRVMSAEGLARAEYSQKTIDGTLHMICSRGGCGEEEHYDGEGASTMSNPLDLRTLDARLAAGAYPHTLGPDAVVAWFDESVALVLHLSLIHI